LTPVDLPFCGRRYNHPSGDAEPRGQGSELARLTGIRRDDHERYRHHLTFGYLRQRLTSAEADDLFRATKGWTAALPARLRIPAIQFCSFRDMFSFRSLHVL